MYSMAGGDPTPRLSRGWRRMLVVVLASSAVTMVLMHLVLWHRPLLLHTATLIVVAVAAFCLWLLADLLRPWLGGQQITPEERAHADSAVRQSYTVLLWTAVGILLYLNLADGRSGLAPDRPHHGVLLLWSFVALVFLLPLGLAAWSDGTTGGRGTAVGPIALMVSRFRGPAGAAYAGGAIATAAAAGLLLLSSGALGETSDTLLNGAAVVALGIVTVIVGVQLRGLLGDRGARRDGRRR